MLVIIIYLMSLVSFGKALYIDDFFSKKACPVPLEKIFQLNKRKKVKKVIRRRKVSKKREIKKNEKNLSPFSKGSTHRRKDY